MIQIGVPAWMTLYLLQDSLRFSVARTRRLLFALQGVMMVLFTLGISYSYFFGQGLVYVVANQIFMLCVLASLVFFLYMVQDDFC